VIGEPLVWNGAHHAFVDDLRARIEALKAQAPPMKWS
jgi:hypothetical protein